ncbi:phage tail protein [Pseudomonas sp. CDFA 602]|uniref:phage tail protein n=1 Tax=Pseudomonas californiensis TaxID=2829823 RepID=UPI001E2C7387|nr:phage tail protein [Pseudomonas californiensis]MCD5993643.1 phage tail protein [Pseudomonas californiensis]MCD5999238.1 phage tail protein [Pseudomonas californiensis]
MTQFITTAGEQLIAQKQAANLPLNITQFIFANIPGLALNAPANRAEVTPAAEHIVYTVAIPDWASGYVNPNQVVYSAQIGSDVGDWDYNWIGLQSDEGVLFAVSYVGLQQKRRNVPPLQTGNNITRNFLVVFDGAMALTGVTVDAKTWQFDYTVRLFGIDQRERLSNRDIYGRAAFFDTALLLEKIAGAYQVAPGIAYGEGIRIQNASHVIVAPPSFPTIAYLDCALERQLNEVVATWKIVFGTGLADYLDSVATQHYVVPIAHLPNANSIVDLRTVVKLGGNGSGLAEQIQVAMPKRSHIYYFAQF